MAYVLAHVLGYSQADTWTEGLQGGFWTWLGFVATVSVSAVLFEKRPWGWFFITAGYQLVNLLVAGVILTMWQ